MRLQAQRAALVPQPLHRLRGSVLDAELLLEPGHRRQRRRRGRRAVEPGGDAVVGELRAIQDERAIDVRALHRAVGADRHLDDDGQALLTLAEGGQVSRELLGKHREDLGGRVDGRRVGPRMAVDGGAELDGGIDVGDRDQDLHLSVGLRLRDRELIEVARVVVVDRGPEEAPQIADGRARFGDSLREGVRLREDLRREVRQQTALDHRPTGDALEIVSALHADSPRHLLARSGPSRPSQNRSAKSRERIVSSAPGGSERWQAPLRSAAPRWNIVQSTVREPPSVYARTRLGAPGAIPPPSSGRHAACSPGWWNRAPRFERASLRQLIVVPGCGKGVATIPS